MDQTQALDISDDDAALMDNPNGQKPVPVGTLVVLAQRDFPETSYLIREGNNVLGRSADVCHVHIPIKVLSKRHAVIEVENAAHFIYDTGSHNKTYKGKAMLKPHVHYELVDGELLKFADVKCIYYKRNIVSTSSTDETESVGDTETASAGPSMAPPPPQDSHRLLANMKVTPKQNLSSSEITLKDFELMSDSEGDDDEDVIRPTPQRKLYAPDTPLSPSKDRNCHLPAPCLQTPIIVPETDSDTDLEESFADTTVKKFPKTDAEPCIPVKPAMEPEEDWENMETQVFVMDRQSDSEDTDQDPTKNDMLNAATQPFPFPVLKQQIAQVQTTSSEETNVSLPVVSGSPPSPPDEKPIINSLDSDLQTVQEKVSRILQSSALSPESTISLTRPSGPANLVASGESDATASGLEMLPALTKMDIGERTESCATNRHGEESDKGDQPPPLLRKTSKRPRKASVTEPHELSTTIAISARSSRRIARRTEPDVNDLQEPLTKSYKATKSKSPNAKKSAAETPSRMSVDDKDSVAVNHNDYDTVPETTAPLIVRSRRAAKTKSHFEEQKSKAETSNRSTPCRIPVENKEPIFEPLDEDDDVLSTPTPSCVQSRRAAKTKSPQNEHKSAVETVKRNSRSRSSVAEPQNGDVSATSMNRIPRSPRATKRKSDQDHPSELSSEQRSSKSVKLSESPKVMFTGMNDENLEQAIRDLGGKLVDSVFECTHLVTDKIRRTVKLLCVLARGGQIVGANWLEECIKSKRFVDSSTFTLLDKEAENQYGFVLRKSLDVAKENGLLREFSVHVTQSVVPIPDQFKTIIECAGGKYLKRLPRFVTDDGNKVVVISCGADMKLCSLAIRAGVPIVTAEFLLTGLLRQKLDIESNLLSEVNTSATVTTDSDEVGKGAKRKSRR